MPRREVFCILSSSNTAEARAGGADDDTALLYGLSSAGVEVATEKMFNGIPGMKGGWLDNWLGDYAETNMGRAALKAAKDSVGEGFEEFTSGMIQPYLAKMWNGDERDFWQTLGESFPDAAYDGFLGAASSFGLSAPGNYANVQNARIVDAALDILDHGGTPSDAQLVKAYTALQELTNSWGDPKKSKWSRNAVEQWTDAGNGYFGSPFSQQTASPAAAKENRKKLSEVFFPPIFNRPAAAQNSQANASETAVQTGAPAAADTNAVSSTAVNSAVTVEGNLLEQKDSILSPAAKEAAQADSITNADSALSPMPNNTETTEKSQTGQEALSQTVDSENEQYQISNQMPLEEQQEKTSADISQNESDGTNTPKLSWKERISVTDGKTILKSNDGERVYEIPSLKEIPVSKKPNGVITLLRSIAHTIEARDYRDFVKAFADKNLLTKFNSKGDVIQANPIQIKSDGTIVLITQTGINDFSKKIRGQGWKASDNVDSMMLLDKLIEEGNRVAEAENKKGRINPYTYYQSKFSIGDRDYNVTIHIKNTPINNLYYYHSLEKIEIAQPNGTSYCKTQRPGPIK